MRKRRLPDYDVDLDAQSSPSLSPLRKKKKLRSLSPPPSPVYIDLTEDEPIDRIESPLRDIDFSELCLDNIRRVFINHSLDYTSTDLKFSSMTDYFPDQFLLYLQSIFDTTLSLLYGMSVKVSFNFNVHMHQADSKGRVFNRILKSFEIPMVVISLVSYSALCSQLLSQIENFISLGSNWKCGFVDSLDMHIAFCDSIQVLARSNYHSSALPKKLAAKSAVVNVANAGKDCFRYALLSVLHYDDVKDNRYRPSKYTQWLNEQDWSGIGFPVTASHLPIFEKNNPGLRINLYEWTDKASRNVHKIRHAPIPKSTDKDVKVVNILYVKLENGEPHYVGITSLDRLLCTKTELINTTFCDRCTKPLKFTVKARGRSKQEVRDNHRVNCYTDKPDSVSIPKNLSLKFKNWCKTQRLPYVVYADCECILIKVNETTTRHQPIAVGALLVPQPNMKNKPLDKPYVEFTGYDCMLQFCRYLNNLSKEVYKWNKFHGNVEHALTVEEEREFQRTNICYVCREGFDNEKKKKVREHNRLTGEYRGAACQPCNTKMRVKRDVLPVFFHNGRGYDNHLLCQHALGDMKNWNVSVIPQTKENYISMKASYVVDRYYSVKKQKEVAVMMNIEFKDSAQFLLSSLKNLVNNLADNDLKFTSDMLPAGVSLDLVRSKGIFPYEWFDSEEKLKCTSLPPREDFYDSLNIEECKEDYYEHAKLVWNKFSCKTFGDYMSLYLKQDVHQLADVFETFRNLAMEEDNLDPVHYYTLPGFTLDSALKMCKADIGLLDSIEKYEYVESGIRGGCSFVNKHHLKLNSSKICPDKFNPSRPVREMFYVDANNLYGHALSEPLPTGDATWLEDCTQFENEDWLRTADFINDQYAYLIDVDLLYPPEIHDKTSDFPLAPEKLKLDSEYHSEHMRKLTEEEYGPGKCRRSTVKLLMTQFHKPGYVVHARLLQFYIKMGMKVSKVNRVLRFKQSRLLQKYIALNSEKRQATDNEFVKDFYKLKNNSLYGKTVENKRRRLQFKLANTPDLFIKYSSMAAFNSYVRFNENLLGCHLLKEHIILDKPIFIGQACLDIAKLIMYELYYDKLKRYETEFDCKINVAGGDTDSLFLFVDNCSVYDKLVPAMIRDDLLDTSNYPKEHVFYSIKNRARLGCLKDESRGSSFYEWILLRPKCYSMVTVEGKESKRAKGVKRPTVQKGINHQDYMKAYSRNMKVCRTQKRIGSKQHVISTFQYEKVALTSFEDKRFWVNNNVSIPYGHYSIEQERPSLNNICDNLPSLILPLD